MPRGVPHTIAKVKPVLIAANGNITEAARRMKVERSHLSDFVNKHPELQQIIKQMRESIADLAEDALQKAIKRGDTACIIFTLKTQGRKRDYCENYKLLEAEALMEKLENALSRLTTVEGKVPGNGIDGNQEENTKRPD
jgi:hypothetical protein